MSHRTRRLILRGGFYLLIAFILVYTVFPFYWAVVSSLKTGSSLFEVDLLPPDPAWTNYVSIFREQPFARNILNSIFISVVTVALSLLLALAAAYALGRIQFRGRSSLLLLVLAVSMFPQVAVLSGMYELILWLGLYDRPWAMILSYMIFTLPFTVWVLTTFMRELPRELEEAAVIDGATKLQVFFKIILATSKPIIATISTLTFIGAWNDYIWPIMVLPAPSGEGWPLYPIQAALNTLQNLPTISTGEVMASLTVTTIPLVVVYILAQKYIVDGFRTAGIK